MYTKYIFLLIYNHSNGIILAYTNTCLHEHMLCERTFLRTYICKRLFPERIFSERLFTRTLVCTTYFHTSVSYEHTFYEHLFLQTHVLRTYICKHLFVQTEQTGKSAGAEQANSRQSRQTRRPKPKTAQRIVRA